ncbi:GNAT family N-acetyltransferase [Actinorhabdospora filicis]|nr:GNAT family N-acetyltransferase [Actinorhabdospora filicis]
MTVRLVTGPLTLRPWTASDAPAVLAAYTDPSVAAWSTEPVTDPAHAEAWIHARVNGWADGSRASFAVTDTESGQILGQVGLRLADGEAEVGYWTLPAARGRGVASTALDALAGWALDALDLTRITLIHSVDNPASCRVAERGGFPLALQLEPTERWPAPGHLHVRKA